MKMILWWRIGAVAPLVSLVGLAAGCGGSRRSARDGLLNDWYGTRTRADRVYVRVDEAVLFGQTGQTDPTEEPIANVASGFVHDR